MALPAVFEAKRAVGIDQQGGVARNALVGQLQVIAGLGAAPNGKRRMCHAHHTARAVRFDDLEHCFGDGLSLGGRHG